MGKTKAPFTDWISVPAAAGLKGTAQSTIREAIQRGALLGQKIGRNYVVSKRAVEEWKPGPQGPKRRVEQ